MEVEDCDTDGSFLEAVQPASKRIAALVQNRRRNEQCFLIVIENTSFHVVLRALTQYNKEKSCFVTRNYKIGKCNNKRNIAL